MLYLSVSDRTELAGLLGLELGAIVSGGSPRGSPAVEDLSDIAFDAGVQLGGGKVVSIRKQALRSVSTFEDRLRKETSTIVEELLAGWRELRER